MLVQSPLAGERPFRPIGSIAVGIQLYQHLRQAIIRGELRPGQALSETEISKKYSVSRQPVREAFIKLAEERLLTVLPQRGTFVVKISVTDVLDARFVREVIEVAVVEEACKVASTEVIARLWNIITAQIQVAHGHNEEFLALDEEFHRTLALSIGRAHAWRVVEGVKAQFDRVRYLSLDDATPISRVIDQHSRIVEGIEAGDPTAAAAAMHTHLREIITALPVIAERYPEAFEP